MALFKKVINHTLKKVTKYIYYLKCKSHTVIKTGVRCLQIKQSEYTGNWRSDVCDSYKDS